MRKNAWTCLLLLLAGLVLGGFIGTAFPDSFLNYGQSFGLNTPVELNMGFIILTFGIKFHITISSVIGVILSFVVYKFIR